MTRPTAFAAPVELGMMLWPAPRPPRQSLSEGLTLARQSGKTIWICGGYDIYKEALPLANELFLTEIDAQFEGDTHFPEWKDSFPEKRSVRTVQTKDFKITFSVYTKGTGYIFPKLA